MSLKSESSPVPVRLSPAQMNALAKLSRKTAQSKSALLRAAAAYSLPRFLTGEADVIAVLNELNAAKS